MNKEQIANLIRKTKIKNAKVKAEAETEKQRKDRIWSESKVLNEKRNKIAAEQEAKDLAERQKRTKLIVERERNKFDLPAMCNFRNKVSFHLERLNSSLEDTGAKSVWQEVIRIIDNYTKQFGN